MIRVTPIAAALLAACSPEPSTVGNQAATAEPTVSPALPPARNYVGRWTGVEGMVLDVQPTARPDRFELRMQYDLDHRQTAPARLDGEALVFERNGGRETLRRTDGTATGLKYLAGKKDCLTVRVGEGYCRD